MIYLLFLTPYLLLKGFSFDPKTNELGKRAEVKSVVEFSESKVYLLQFKNPLDRNQLEELYSRAEILGYIPEFAYAVRFKNYSDFEYYYNKFIAGDKEVNFLGKFLPEFKVSPLAGKKSHNPDSPYRDAIDRGLRPFLIQLYPGTDPEQFVKKISVYGEIKDISRGIFFDRIEIWASPDVLYSIAMEDEVEYIWEKDDEVMFNYRHRQVTQSGAVRDTVMYKQGIKGNGERVAIMDSGLDQQSCFFSRNGKVISYKAYGGGDTKACDYSQDFSHGTHVAGTVAGWLNGTNHKYDGVAYQAGIVFQDIKPNSTCGTGYVYPPNDLTNAFQDAYNRGARVHTNSWGGGNGTYENYCQDQDAFIYANPDFIVLFAMGNSGNQGMGDEAAAKNNLGIGASGMPGENSFNGRANYSSVGPTQDGRIKPDVMNVAGSGNQNDDSTWTWSALSYYSQNPDCYIAGSVGTSMATPGAAGAVVLLQEYFKEGHHPDYGNYTPTASLLKATLVAGADILSNNVVDNNVGWGRINLDYACEFAGETRDLAFAEDVLNGTGDSLVYSLEVVSSSEPLKVVLCWIDPAAAPNSDPALINDLDLKVIDPNNNYYTGNNFKNGQSRRNNTSWDRLNNIEVVYVTNPTPGIWKVVVKGYNIALLSQPGKNQILKQAQDFSVAVTGDLGAFQLGEEESYFVALPLSEGIKLRARGLYRNGDVVLKRDGAIVYTGKTMNGKFEYIDKEVRENKSYTYSLISISPSGLKKTFGPVVVTYSGIPLSLNVPSVNGKRFKVMFSVPSNGNIELSLFDMSGRKIRNLINNTLESGYYNMEFNGMKLKSGVYILMLRHNGEVKKTKVTLFK